MTMNADVGEARLAPCGSEAVMVERAAVRLARVGLVVLDLVELHDDISDDR